jgi:WD40 repeat protein
MRTYLLILSIFHLLFLHGACLVHTKSFLLQIDFTVVQAVIVQNGSLFHTTGIDIVQRDTDTGLIRRTLRAHSQAVQTMVLVDRQTLVSVAWDDLLVVWDLPTGSIIRRINLTPRNLYPQKLSFTDSRIIVGNAGNSLTIANYQTGRILNNLQTGSGVLSILVHNNLIYIAKSGPPYVVTVSVLNGLPDGSYTGKIRCSLDSLL